MRLQPPAPNLLPTDLYLNDEIINRTLEMLYHHSPFAKSRYFLPPAFLEFIQQPDCDDALPRYHRRALELQDGPSLDSEFLLLPYHITETHWTLLVRHNGANTGPHTVSHDSLSIPMDFTTTV